MLSLAFCALLAILLFCYCCFSCLKPKNYPPGPKWFPLMGCFPKFYQLQKKSGYIYKACEELSQTYGPIVGLKLGKQHVVVISSYDLVKKVLLREEFNGRPKGFFFRVRALGKDLGVLFTEGTIWSQHRRFTMRHLKAFGLGQDSMNLRLVDEAQSLIEYLKLQSQSGPVPMHRAFDVAVLNALWIMFAGHRFDHEDEKLKNILIVVHEIFRLNDTVGGPVSHLPFLRHIIPGLIGYSDLVSMLQRLWSFLGDEIAEHETSLPADQPRDLIDAFLMEIKAREANDEKHDEDSIFDRENLLILCLDLFLAGSKTTTDTLSAIFAFLGLNPQWIKQLQKEMDDVVGRDRSPNLTDMPALPKVEAFLAEAQRVLILAPLGVPHRTVRDASLEGYVIPKDTIVLLNYYSASNDKAHWDEPEEFRPQRFLDSEGRFKQLSAAMPFGAGKRRCLGEGLARASLFLFFTHVLHHFDFGVARDHAKPDLGGYDGFVISPKPYYLELRARSD